MWTTSPAGRVRQQPGIASFMSIRPSGPEWDGNLIQIKPGMAFLHQTRELGPGGTDRAVQIEDVPPQAYASIGVRRACTRGTTPKAWLTCPHGLPVSSCARLMNRPVASGATARSSPGSCDRGRLRFRWLDI